MKISAVVFDIGNVLIGWTPAQFFDEKIVIKKYIDSISNIVNNEKIF